MLAGEILLALEAGRVIYVKFPSSEQKYPLTDARMSAHGVDVYNKDLGWRILDYEAMLEFEEFSSGPDYS